MQIFQLNENKDWFPPAYMAHPSGIVAVGGDLSPERILIAYRHGAFPWFDPEDDILWWSPDPRFVLFPADLQVSKSMRQLFRRRAFEVTFDEDFLGVMEGCRMTPRPGQDGTWITDDIIRSYHRLHTEGRAHSVEVWQDGQLVGGLYGLVLGKCFFGESMFSRVSNASKYGFITLVKNLAAHRFELIDCQVHTQHLESLGASMIPRIRFLSVLEKHIHSPVEYPSWKGIFEPLSV